MEEVRTEEEIQQSISAAFDSVGLINGIIDGSQMADADAQDKADTVERNVGHLKIMLGHDWFSEGCSADQLSDLNAAVTAGEGYSA